MSKNKTEKYLPLRCCDKAEKVLKPFKNLKDGEVEALFNKDCAITTQKRILEANPQLIQIFKEFVDSSEEIQNGYLTTLSCCVLMKWWAENKQVFRFDKEFLNALIDSEKFIMIKDFFDHLPYSIFYVDLSENREICNIISCEGLIVYPCKTKIGDCEVYKIHVVALTQDTKFFSNTLLIENKTEYDISLDISSDDNKRTEFITKVIMQILTYLASAQPDIEESNETKRTYRKPKPNEKPKNKFSEVRKWDVGIRYGVAYNKWKREKDNSKSPNSEGTGNKKRPHVRRAHWHRFWYGKRNSGERELRAVWISELLVNTNTNNESPVVIHKVNEN